MNFNSIAIAALALLSSMAAQAQTGTKVYIVQLKEEPAATYQGTTAGYAATQAPAGTLFRSRTQGALSYSSYLRSKQLAVLSTVSSGQVISHLDTVFNGFTASLTPAQAAALQLNANVAAIAEDQIVHPVTISTPAFLGLTAPGGVWSQNDANGIAIKGENMVLGDLDTGIWPENPSFADHVDGNGQPTFNGGTLAYGPPPATFTGTCVAGEAFVPATACNNKLIGARAFKANMIAAGGVIDPATGFDSARDDLPPIGVGHGDHTASTVAGNADAPVTISGINFGPASGMAPRARISAYKVCFNHFAAGTTVAVNNCSTADSMAAIDQAVKDGVNAINYSIGGPTGSTNDLAEQAFYRAALAGVFVSAAAGNSGPSNTVNHPAPWLTTVAATTHDRIESGDVLLGNGNKYTGASLTPAAAPSAPLIRAEDAGAGGGDASLCFTGSDISGYPTAKQVLLDPAKVAGKIVICTRGTSARVSKSLEVKTAGGIGMVLVDNGAGLVAETHSVPTVHVSAADGAKIKAYAISTTSPTASATAFYFGKQPAPKVASFSGRGPNLADVNILKPDVAAPGVGVIAAVNTALTAAQKAQLAAGTYTPGGAWGSLDGTSMATPHITGLSLLLKQAHPTWSPAAIKSALMTTAMDTLDDGLTGMQNGRLPWSQGAGFVVPNKAIDPGLVYDMGKADYVKYQCLTQKSLVAAADCITYGTLDQTYNLNLPSITLGSMLGPTTVKRTVTNVGAASTTYRATASLTGMSVAVTPSTLTLTPGQSGSYTVTVTPSPETPKFTWQYGSLSWTDGAHVVRSPLQANIGSAVLAPGDASANTVSGSRTFTVQTGYAGKLVALKGMKDVTLGAPTTLTPNPSIDAAGACPNAAASLSMAVYQMTVPAGAIVARFALRQADVSGATDDNDLAVVLPNGKVASSENGGSHETVELSNPAPGNYKVCVSAYASANPTSTHRLSSWIVKPGDTTDGAFKVLVPSSVYAGGTATVGMSWSGLAASHRYVGGTQFLDASGSPAAATVLYVDTTPGTPLDIITTTGNSKHSMAN